MSFETDGDFEARVRESFARQAVMETLGAQLLAVRAGETEIEMSYEARLTQQHGFLHAGIVTTVLDSAAGYAAMSVMPAAASVLTVELKTSLLRPAAGARFRFEGRVLKAGRSIIFAEARAFGLKDGQSRELAHLTASMMVIEGRAGVRG